MPVAVRFRVGLVALVATALAIAGAVVGETGRRRQRAHRLF